MKGLKKTKTELEVYLDPLRTKFDGDWELLLKSNYWPKTPVDLQPQQALYGRHHCCLMLGEMYPDAPGPQLEPICRLRPLRTRCPRPPAWREQSRDVTWTWRMPLGEDTWRFMMAPEEGTGPESCLGWDISSLGCFCLSYSLKENCWLKTRKLFIVCCAALTGSLV